MNRIFYILFIFLAFVTPLQAIYYSDSNQSNSTEMTNERLDTEKFEQLKKQKNATPEEKRQALVNALQNPTEENLIDATAKTTNINTLANRLASAKEAVEKVKKAHTYISSLVDLTNGTISAFPIGFGREDDYTLAITKVEKVTNGDHEDTWIYLAANIEFKETKEKNADGQVQYKSISFDGKAKIEGVNGIGTNGYLTLITEVERPIGSACTLTFLEGTELHFGCDGFEDIKAKMRLDVINDAIYAVDADGKNKGQLTTEIETVIYSLNDFTVDVSFADKFAVRGLDGFRFLLYNAIFDHSFTSTPTTLRFPNDYHTTEEARKEWRGVAVAETTIELPQYMRDATDKDATTTVSLRNVFLDGNGLSCEADVADLSHSKEIDASKWTMAADNFELCILRNEIRKAYFDGRLSIPPFKTVNQFSATYRQENKAFLFETNFGRDVSFDMLKANLEIDDDSKIELKVINNQIQPSLKLHGRISIDAPTSKDATFALQVPDLAFENMLISRDKFEIGTISLEGSASAKLGGFEVNMSNIKSISNPDEQGISFDAEVKITEIFKGNTKIQLTGDPNTFKFKDVSVSKINIRFNKEKAFTIEGGVELMKGDATYGKGFRGNMTINLFENTGVGIEAVGVFGNKDGYRYFMTDGLYTDNNHVGIPIASLNLYGFGGGIYYHMRPDNGNTTSTFGESVSGINYVPDKTVGFGLMSRAKICLLKNPNLFDADVNFDMQFNNNWGLNFVQLRGDAAMFSGNESINTKFIDDMKNASNKLSAFQDGYIKQYEVNEVENIVPTKKGGAILGAMLMRYDAPNKTFTADMSSYLNIADVVKGNGPNDRVGWASAMISPQKNYLYLGTPQDRNSVTILEKIHADNYFMLGNDIPPLPELPKEARELLKDRYAPSQRTNLAALGNGSGVALGLSAKADLKLDEAIRPFYAELAAGVGTEFLLKKYSAQAHCEGYDAPIGANGWYAQAQAWMYAHADLGIRVRLFRSRERKFSILSANVAAYLQGGAPRPIYFKGALAGNYRVMGGLIKGKYSVGFSIGNECVMVGGSPFGENVIAQITPADGNKDVNVFVAPQLVLNIPVGEEMKIQEDDGRINVYRIHIDEFYIKNMHDNTFVEFTPSYSDDNRVITYESDDPLKSQKKYQIYAKVSFEQKIGNEWKPYTESGGSAYYEEKLVEFTSGDRPKNIDKQYIAHAYPADRQYNYLPDEYKEKQAYFLIKKNFGYLFNEERPEGFTQKVQLTSFGGSTQTTSFTYKTTSNTPGYCFEIDIPTKDLKFKNDEIYNLAIVNVPISVAKKDANINTFDKELTEQKINDDTEVTETIHEAEGDLALLEQTEILSIDFRTSSYNTFREKMEKMEVDNIVPWQEENSATTYNFISNISDKSATTEMFDIYEYTYGNWETNLIRLQPDYQNMPYYTQLVAPLMYENADVERVVKNYDPPSHSKVVAIGLNTDDLQITKGDLEIGHHNDFISKFGAFNNHMQKYMDIDYLKINEVLANTFISSNNRPAGVKKFMDSNSIPTKIKGNYPIRVKYTLPGKGIVTTDYQINTQW